MDGREHGRDCLRLTFGAKDRRLTGSLSPQHGGLLLTFGGENLGLLDPFRVENRSAPVALRPHLLGRASWMVVGGSIDFSSTRLTLIPHLPVASSSTTRSCPFMWSREVNAASSVMPPITLRRVGDGELLHGLERIGDLVRHGPGIGDLEVHDGVDLDHQVVLRDHGLW